jgi:hypothetical protein
MSRRQRREVGYGVTVWYEYVDLEGLERCGNSKVPMFRGQAQGITGFASARRVNKEKQWITHIDNGTISFN